jgi:small-conductance mechanosensitive channel
VDGYGRLFGLVVLIFAALPLHAQAPSIGYPVTLDGNVLFTIQAPRAPYTAEQRARDSSADLFEVAKDRNVRAEHFRIVPGETDTIVLAGRTFLLALTDEDARREHRSRAELVAERTRIIEQAIADYRRRAPWVMARSIALAALCWVAIALLLRTLRVSTRRIVTKLDDRYHRFLASRNLDSLHKHFGKQLFRMTNGAVRFSTAVVAVVAVSMAASYSLGLFPETAGISRVVLDRLQSAAAFVARSLIAYLPRLAVVLLVIAATYCVIKVLGSLARAVESGAISIPGFASEWATPTNRILDFVLVVFALVVVFPYLPGGDSPAFRGISIFIGVLVSLGSISAMGNLIAGITLTYMRAFHVGDRVKISDTVGDVLERSLLVTRLRTIKNVEIVIPNSMMLSAHILNYSVEANDKGLILNTTVTFGYSTPWRTVHRLLIQAALGVEGILAEPPPFVLQTSLDDVHVT